MLSRQAAREHIQARFDAIMLMLKLLKVYFLDLKLPSFYPEPSRAVLCSLDSKGLGHKANARP